MKQLILFAKNKTIRAVISNILNSKVKNKRVTNGNFR